MAKINYAHAGDHAVVAFTGELDWDAVRELVDAVELLVEEYFYTTVELSVTSPGGDVRAFEYYLGRQAVWRRHGVRVRTRVYSEAGSAAALLVSLGDERVADPGATLSYHCIHMSPSGVNAETTAAISSVLRELDEGFIARLAARGLKGRAEVEHAAERSDRALLRQLWPEFGRKAGGAARRPPRCASSPGPSAGTSTRRCAGEIVAISRAFTGGFSRSRAGSRRASRSCFGSSTGSAPSPRRRRPRRATRGSRYRSGRRCTRLKEPCPAKL